MSSSLFLFCLVTISFRELEKEIAGQQDMHQDLRSALLGDTARLDNLRQVQASRQEKLSKLDLQYHNKKASMQEQIAQISQSVLPLLLTCPCCVQIMCWNVVNMLWVIDKTLPSQFRPPLIVLGDCSAKKRRKKDVMWTSLSLMVRHLCAEQMYPGFYSISSHLKPAPASVPFCHDFSVWFHKSSLKIFLFLQIFS